MVVGWVDGEVKHARIGPESVGHASGRRFVEIKRKPVAELKIGAPIVNMRTMFTAARNFAASIGSMHIFA